MRVIGRASASLALGGSATFFGRTASLALRRSTVKAKMN